ncbi:MAG TPA: hypothetical protein VKI65_01670 [Gemmataceae bacterium]|nr:hypothetical protein [Gemmataceae bacterium]
MSCVGTLRLRRRWWGSRCGCEPLGYGIDEVLRLDGHYTRALQQNLCRLSADVSFAKSREHLQALRGICVSKEALRQACHRQGRRLAHWQATEESTPKAFAAAAGQVEFTVDAGKVNTLEAGWKDLKIGVLQKRPCGEPATPAEWQTRHLPAPTAGAAWATIAPAKQFRRSWRRWSRRLGVRQAGELHVLGDGADWIWRAVERVFTGSQQTLDIYHGCGHLAQAGERLYGEGTPAAAFLERGRRLLLESGWSGICQLVGEEYAQGDTPERRSALEKLVGYFAKHTHRLAYRQRLAAGQAIGSGSVEGWAKTLGLRLKARGARWRRKNVPGMSALICVRNGGQWSAYWSGAA